MTNERETSSNPTRRLGAAMLAVGLAIAFLGVVLLVLDPGDATDDTPAAPDSATSTSTSTSTVSSTLTATSTPDTTSTSTPIPTASPTPSPTATPEPTPPPLTSDDAATFFEHLVQALTIGDADFLFANLHPDVTDRYGQATCTAYLASVPLETSIQVRDIEGPSPWDWTTNDGFVATYPDTWSVEIERLAGSQTLVQVMHIAAVDGRVVWFTDCGEPSPS